MVYQNHILDNITALNLAVNLKKTVKNTKIVLVKNSIVTCRSAMNLQRETKLKDYLFESGPYILYLAKCRLHILLSIADKKN